MSAIESEDVISAAKTIVASNLALAAANLIAAGQTPEEAMNLATNLYHTLKKQLAV